MRVEGQKVTVAFGLRDAAGLDTYAKLKAAIDAAGVNGGIELKITIPGIRIATNLAAGTALTSVGTVTGKFDAIATSASGKREIFAFEWTATQLDSGRDAMATDDDTIQLSVKVGSGKVTVRYVDEDGNDIAAAETLAGAVGDSYETEAKAIEGYELKMTPANAMGSFAVDSQTVTYVYAKKSAQPSEPQGPGKPAEPQKPTGPQGPQEPVEPQRSGKGGSPKGRPLPRTGDAAPAHAVEIAAVGVMTVLGSVALRRRRHGSARSVSCNARAVVRPPGSGGIFIAL